METKDTTVVTILVSMSEVSLSAVTSSLPEQIADVIPI